MKLTQLLGAVFGFLVAIGVASGQEQRGADAATVKEQARAIVERARGLYEKCSTFKVKVEGVRIIRREGSAEAEENTYWTNDIEFARPGSIRVEDRLEINGANTRVAWGASKETKELVQAAALPEKEVAAWLRAQVWLHAVPDGVLRTVLGENPAEFLFSQVEEVVDVRTEVLGKEPVRVLVCRGERGLWKAKTSPVEIRLYFSEATGLLREIAFEDAAAQRVQDQLKGSVAPRILEASDRVRFTGQELNVPIQDERFEAPEGYRRVVLPSSPMGASVLMAIGKEALRPEMVVKLAGKPTVVLTSFMGMGVEFLPSMEWLHLAVQPAAQVLSGRPDAQAGVMYDAAKITHPSTKASEFYAVAGISTQRYSPMLFLIDGKNHLQGVFTGYMPVYTLKLRELIQKMDADGGSVWMKETLETWGRGEVAEEK
ncbi:MAG: hypothetical protein H7210_09250 [Pyrinomonadaceae bacterium]|nr:hypothetical protein [Phycisphaerales bacterium]